MAREESKHNNHKKSITEMTRWLSRGSAKYKTCLLHVVAPNGRGLQSTPLKRSKDPLEYHGVCFSFLYPVREESPQLGVSRPYKDVHKEARSKGGKQHTQIHSKSAHTRPRIELTRLSQSSHLEQSSNHLETQTNAQRLSVDDQECSKVAWSSPPCA